MCSLRLALLLLLLLAYWCCWAFAVACVKLSSWTINIGKSAADRGDNSTAIFFPRKGDQ